MGNLVFNLNRNLISKLASIFAAVIFLSGCGSDNDRLRERAGIEGEESARKSVEAENEVRAQRAKVAEESLQKLNRFIQASIGTFSGELVTDDGKKFVLSVTLYSSLPPYKPEGRIRPEDEIIKNIEGLYLNASTKIIDNSGKPIRGCTVVQIKPDFEKGEFTLINAGCNDTFSFYLDPGSTPGLRASINGEGQRIFPAEILEGKVDKVPEFYAVARSTLWSREFGLTMKRQAGESVGSIDENDIRGNSDNQTLIAQRKEQELLRMHKILAALTGIFEGKVADAEEKGAEFHLTLQLNPNRSPYVPVDQVRSLSQIEKDIEELALEGKMTLTNSLGGFVHCESPLSDFNYKTGRIKFKFDCPNSGTASTKASSENEFKELVAEILNGSLPFVDDLNADILLSYKNENLSFNLKRVKP